MFKIIKQSEINSAIIEACHDLSVEMIGKHQTYRNLMRSMSPALIGLSRRLDRVSEIMRNSSLTLQNLNGFYGDRNKRNFKKLRCR